MAPSGRDASRNIVSQLAAQQSVDVQGVLRGACSYCTECPQFLVSAGSGHISCQYCGCPPAKHQHHHRKRRRDTPTPFRERPVSTSTANATCSSIGSQTEGLSDSDYDIAEGQGSKGGKRRKGHTFEMGTWRPHHQENIPPPRVRCLLEKEPVSREMAESHSWSRQDTSPNIYVRLDDPLTFHRNPVYQTSDAIRGRGLGARLSSLGPRGRGAVRTGYLSGLHVWELFWPQESRGTHPVVGVATRECPLTSPGYKRLVGSTSNSWGWCLKSLRCYHDSPKYRRGVTYPRDVTEETVVPDTFYMILDMDRGTLAFQVEEDFLGIAFSGLRGIELFPIVSAVWGHCEVTLTYINQHQNSDEEST